MQTESTDKREIRDVAELLKALGDPTRLAIVRMLAGKELCVCEIMDAFAMSQPAISHHLRILRQADVVSDEKDGKWVYYSLRPDTLRLVRGFFDAIPGDAVVGERIKRVV